jgi:hypothetical protein
MRSRRRRLASDVPCFYTGRAVSGHGLPTLADDPRQEHRSAGLLLDERECGASADRVLVHTSFSSLVSGRGSIPDTPAFAFQQLPYPP